MNNLSKEKRGIPWRKIFAHQNVVKNAAISVFVMLALTATFWVFNAEFHISGFFACAIGPYLNDIWAARKDERFQTP